MNTEQAQMLIDAANRLAAAIEAQTEVQREFVKLQRQLLALQAPDVVTNA